MSPQNDVFEDDQVATKRIFNRGAPMPLPHAGTGDHDTYEAELRASRRAPVDIQRQTSSRSTSGENSRRSPQANRRRSCDSSCEPPQES